MAIPSDKPDKPAPGADQPPAGQTTDTHEADHDSHSHLLHDFIHVTKAGDSSFVPQAPNPLETDPAYGAPVNQKSGGDSQPATKQPQTAEGADGFQIVDNTKPDKKLTPVEMLAGMKKLLGKETAQLVSPCTIAELDKQGIKPDIIIDEKGVAVLNPNKTEQERDPSGKVYIAIQTHDAAVSAIIAADTVQKATVRDLIGYFKMQHPSAPLPDEWLGVLSRTPDLPPPNSHETVSSGGGISYSTGAFRNTGDGGGYAGASGATPGMISQHVPREVPHGANVGHQSTIERGLETPLKSFLNGNKLVDRIVSAVSGNEGGFTSVNPNDAGYGVSIGIRQWNQKAGELPTLLKAWHDANPTKFAGIFGQYANNLLNESWVRNANFHAQPGLMEDMKKALADKDFQNVQVDLARQFVVQGIKLGWKYGFKTEAGLALVVDIANQKGFGGAEAALKAAGSSGDEQSRAHRLEAAAHRPGGQARMAAIEKKFDYKQTETT